MSSEIRPSSQVRLAITDGSEKGKEPEQATGTPVVQATGFGTLPAHLLQLVFQYVDAGTQGSLPRVSRHWESVANNFPRQLPQWTAAIPRCFRTAFGSIKGKSERETFLKFWKAQRSGFKEQVPSPNPTVPCLLIQGLERKEQRLKDESLIAFCNALEDRIKTTLLPILNADLSIEAKAQALRLELSRSQVVQATRVLDLMDKHLTSIPEELRFFRNLQEFRASNNQLSELPEELFQGLTALQQLDLSSNELQKLPEKIFQGLTALTHLYLSHNKLIELPEKLFKGLAALQQLYLNDNMLTQLPEEVFKGLWALRTLNLSRNPLNGLPEKLFSGLIYLQRIDLLETPITQLSKKLLQNLFSQNPVFKGYPSELFPRTEDPELTRFRNNTFVIGFAPSFKPWTWF